jgi:hypothetical protein
MGLSWVVRVQTNLLYDISDVGPSEHQVRQGACDALELGGILDRRPEICNKLCLKVNRSHARLTVIHGRTLDGVQLVGALVEEQPI